MRGVSVVALAASLALCDHGALAAQTDSSRGAWLTASLGAAGSQPPHGAGEPVLALGANLQRGSWLTSLRYQSVGNGIGATEIRALSILLGDATTSNGFGFAALSAGVTGLQRRDCTAGCGLFADTGRELGPAQSGVGAMLAGDAALRIGHGAGASIGLTGYLDVNTAKSYAGVGLEIGIGKWR